MLKFIANHIQVTYS